MKSTRYKALAAAFSLALSSTAFAQEDKAAQAPATIMMAQTCGGCHGTQGAVQGTAFMPLAGMPEGQFIRAMKAFADGTRPSTLMSPLARSFSAEEIQAMAAYFAQFPKVQAQ
ncbi:c-type cytochrome [Halothiobacillus sp. DCM-1]|uniref:c-type cytochrome n=1 Tax=Halothiobacillus sp. DCM-1 TaxID=3112558 RepID=UPI0032430C05